jgi:hypothetical protein
MNPPDANKGRFKAVSHLDDVELLDRALALENLSTDQRAAFASMREALAKNDSFVLTPRQRQWVEGRMKRFDAIALSSLKTILEDLDRIGAKR